MKKTTIGLLSALALITILVPLTVSAAPTMDEVLEVIKNKYIFDGRIYTAVTDGETLYLGGDFQAVLAPGAPEVVRREVAAIDLTTYELTDFDPDVTAASGDGTTYALALSPDGETLYIGGNIAAVNNDTAPRAFLAAVSTDTGTATAFDPDLDYTVYALAVSPDGETVYAGGAFVTINGEDVEQPYLASFDAVSGVAHEFYPSVGNTVYALALSPDGGTLYVGGNMVEGVLVFDSTTGETLLTPSTQPDGIVKVLAVSPDGTTLYTGGLFGAFEADSVSVGEGFIADADTGAVVDSSNILSTNASTVHTSISDGDGGWYVGGSFNRINGEVWNSRIVHILSDNTVDPAFEPDFGGESGVVYALALDDDGTLYAGGEFSNLDSEERVGLAAFDTSDGSLLSFDPSLGVSADGVRVRTLELDGDTLYVGGVFTCVGYDYDGDVCPEGSTRNNLAAIDTTTGFATAFDPDISGDDGVYDIDISVDGEVLYVGGGFTTVNGDQSRVDFTAFSLVPETLGDVTALNPGIESGADTVHTIAESSDGSTVYVGGDFYTIVDLEPAYTILGAVDVEADGGAGAFSETFPVVLNGAGEIVHTLALSSDDEVLYVGGAFFESGNVAFALSTQDGSVVDGFDPGISTDDTVYTIGGPQEGNIFIGGSGMYVPGEGGGARQGLAALDTSDLSLTDFNPDVEFLSVFSLALSSDGETLYAGGDAGGGPFLSSFDTDSEASDFSPEFSGEGDVYALALSPSDDELYAVGDNVTSGNYAIFSSLPAEEPSVEEDNGGGGGSGSRTHTTHTTLLEQLQLQLIELLKQLLQVLLTQQQN